MSFGLRAQPQFVVGPSSLAAAGQICVARNGQPNVTILPNEKGSGLKMYLMAPLQQAHIFLSVVKKQMKKNQKKTKKKNKNRNSETKETATSQAPSSSRASRRRPSSPILPGAIVWLHGLGDTSHSWDSRFASYFTMEKGRFLQPTAPEQRVTAHISTATTTAPPTVSWFDIQTLPISAQEPGTPPIAGLEESVATIHALLDELQTIHHVLPRNIVLGGFSQGGALAIEAGTTYAHALAGIVSISGWCPNRQASKQFTTPIFFSSGTSDPVVLYEMSKESCNCLVQWSANKTHQSVVRNVVQRGKHAPKGKELKAASVFIKQCLESVPPGVVTVTVK
jgi:predicted esterase